MLFSFRIIFDRHTTIRDCRNLEVLKIHSDMGVCTCVHAQRAEFGILGLGAEIIRSLVLGI